VPGGNTGAIHHVAFECDDYEDCLSRIEVMGLRYETAEVSEISLRQIFVNDPNNVLLELNFRG
jgi:catechol 2,3-dioxygenase-like lactoylglutathione lyase family enzyme